jgi:hypothetical protein
MPKITVKDLLSSEKSLPIREQILCFLTQNLLCLGENEKRLDWFSGIFVFVFKKIFFEFFVLN